MNLNLVDPGPQNNAVHHLNDHPIHGNRRGTELDHGLLHVRGYVKPFLPADTAPPHIWPVNARDWGFTEIRPFDTLYAPKPSSRVINHPIMRNGRLTLSGKEAYPAFMYRLSENAPQCSKVVSMLVTHWEIDPHTHDAILDQCWGCRCMGRRCTMQGYRIGREHGPGRDGNGGNGNDLPPPMRPLPPWKDRRGRGGYDPFINDESEDDNSEDDNNNGGGWGGGGSGGGGGDVGGRGPGRDGGSEQDDKPLGSEDDDDEEGNPLRLQGGARSTSMDEDESDSESYIIVKKPRHHNRVIKSESLEPATSQSAVDDEEVVWVSGEPDVVWMSGGPDPPRGLGSRGSPLRLREDDEDQWVLV